LFNVTNKTGPKNPMKANGQNHHMEDKKEGQKKAPPVITKKGKN
jgi:hypothetical protein